MPSIGDALPSPQLGLSQAPVAFVPLSVADRMGCPVAVRRTRPRAPLRPEPPPLLYFPSFRVSPEARRGRHLRSSPSHTRLSRESGAAAGGLRVSELTALRARGRGRGGPGTDGAWVSQWKNRRTQKGRRLLRGGPRVTRARSSPGRAPGFLVPAPEPREPPSPSLFCLFFPPSPTSAWERGKGGGEGDRAGATKSEAHSNTTSDQTRQPAEFKHITKRRKRN